MRDFNRFSFFIFFILTWGQLNQSYSWAMNCWNNDDEKEERVLLIVTPKNLSTYVESIASEPKRRQSIKLTGSAVVGITATTWLFFLSRDLIGNFTGIRSLGYIAAPIAQISSAYLIFDFTYEKLSAIQKFFKPSWKIIAAKKTKKEWILSFAEEGVENVFGVIMASIGCYYTYTYLSPLIAQGVFVVIAPTLVGQTILGSGCIKKLGRFLYAEIDQCLLKKKWSEEKIIQENVKENLGKLAREFKKLSPEEAEELLRKIKLGKLWEVLNKPEIDNERASKKPVVSILGCIIGVVGSYAAIKATEVAVNLFLQGLGADPSTAYYISKTSGVLGGIAAASYRGLGTGTTFKDLYGYFSGKHPPKKQIATDITSGICSVISTSSRVKIVLDTNISNPIGRNIVIVCSIIGNASADFFGWKGLLDKIIHRFGPRQELIKLLDRLASEVPNMDKKNIKLLYDHFNRQYININQTTN